MWQSWLSPLTPTARKMGRREEKKLETRQRLRAAAFTLFDKRGYDATKVEDVARAAGVSTRTAFRYFPHKADLVFADLDEGGERFIAMLRARPRSEPPFIALRNAMIEFAPSLDSPLTLDRGRIVVANPILYRYSLEVRDRWAANLGEALVERAGPEADADELRLLGHIASAVMLVATRTWRDAGADRDTLPEIVAQLLDDLPRLVRMPS
jgi:AcrR family transcriptional regulator